MFFFKLLATTTKKIKGSVVKNLQGPPLPPPPTQSHSSFYQIIGNELNKEYHKILIT